MLVLGIDPGSRVTGFGLVERERTGLTCIRSGIISLSGEIPFYERIHRIYHSITEIMTQHRPDQLAIEDCFFAKNVKSSLKIGHARGAVLIAAVECGLEIFEYSPLEIKKAVAGYGSASKEQVRSMIRWMLKMTAEPPLDASDALATAICHLNWKRFDAA
jgi:crossover junction endodeoxyribonuclease RuvC